MNVWSLKSPCCIISYQREDNFNWCARFQSNCCTHTPSLDSPHKLLPIICQCHFHPYPICCHWFSLKNLRIKTTTKCFTYRETQFLHKKNQRFWWYSAKDYIYDEIEKEKKSTTLVHFEDTLKYSANSEFLLHFQKWTWNFQDLGRRRHTLGYFHMESETRSTCLDKLINVVQWVRHHQMAVQEHPAKIWMHLLDHNLAFHTLENCWLWKKKSKGAKHILHGFPMRRFAMRSSVKTK